VDSPEASGASELAATTPAPQSKWRAFWIRCLIGPLLLLAIWAIYGMDRDFGGGRISAALLGLLSLAGLWEYVAMVRHAGHPIAGWLLLPTALALHVSAFFLGWHHVDHELYPPMLATMGLLFPLSLRSLTAKHVGLGFEELGSSLLGIVLFVWPFYLAQGLAIRMLPALLFVVLVAKSGDIGAYLAGTFFGRTKLIPHVSAGKTVEGALGGVLVSIGVALAFRESLISELRLSGIGCALVACLISVATQVGDLVESLLKRRCKVKDSSRLLPVHGGILDLTDSLLFSIPAFFVVVACRT
jgi:phosphatidate cytidylyltransferase